MANRYVAQGCGFVLACVVAGYFLSALYESDSLGSSGDASGSDGTSVFEQSNSAATAEPAETVAETRPQWLIGAWAPKGECELDEAYYFRFSEGGTFETPEMSGTYYVEDGTIQLRDVQASEEIRNSFLGGSDVGEIPFERNAGDLNLKNMTIERCGNA